MIQNNIVTCLSPHSPGNDHIDRFRNKQSCISTNNIGKQPTDLGQTGIG